MAEPRPDGTGSETTASRSYASVAMVAVVALLTIVGVDLGLQTICPIKRLREVKEAVADYEESDPTILVLGSSHARSFVTIDGLLATEGGGRDRMLAVPVEWGKFRSYAWVLENRIAPLVDEKAQSGELRRKRLQRFFLITAWWDACAMDGDPPVFNLPSRAWRLQDFVGGVQRQGLDWYTRNYVTSRWLELMQGSLLATDRGHWRAAESVKSLFITRSQEQIARTTAKRMESWREIMLRGPKCLHHPEEMKSLDRILDWAQARYETTMVLYPMMPASVTPEIQRVTLDPFGARMKQIAEARKIRFIDITTGSPVGDEDFAPDFDHLTRAGDDEFARWFLDTHLGFLSAPPAPAGSAP